MTMVLDSNGWRNATSAEETAILAKKKAAWAGAFKTKVQYAKAQGWI